MVDLVPQLLVFFVWVLLSECCVHFGAGLSLQGFRYRAPLQGAAAVASFARCCAGSMFSGLEWPWWEGSPLSLVLASFWLRFLLLMLGLRWFWEQHKQHKTQKQHQKSKAQAAAPAEPGANLHRFCCRSGSCRLRPALRRNAKAKVYCDCARAMFCRFSLVLSEERARAVFPACQ